MNESNSDSEFEDTNSTASSGRPDFNMARTLVDSLTSSTGSPVAESTRDEELERDVAPDDTFTVEPDNPSVNDSDTPDTNDPQANEPNIPEE